MQAVQIAGGFFSRLLERDRLRRTRRKAWITLSNKEARLDDDCFNFKQSWFSALIDGRLRKPERRGGIYSKYAHLGREEG